MRIVYSKISLIILSVMVFLASVQPVLGRNTIPTKNVFHEPVMVSSLSAANSSGDEYKSTLPVYVPASPTASSLVAYADYPVSHYTGVPDISIPLYEIDIDGYKLPITLSYHASGVRVNQEASWVGLGWALNAGGVVSRTVKCADDFHEYYTPNIQRGYYDGPEASNPYSEDFYSGFIVDGTIYRTLIADSEPDIFRYSIPEGSGKFLIDKSRGAALFDKSANVKVELLTENFKKYFNLITSDGTQYLFKEYETTRSYGREGFMNMNLDNATKYDENVNDINLTYALGSEYTSSWYLTRITTATNRVITFVYATESFVAPVQESCMKYTPILFSGSSICGPGNDIRYSCNKTIVEGLRLSQIIWDGGRIDFNCTSREDMVGVIDGPQQQKLSTLKVYDKNSVCVKSFQFDYDYFNSSYQGTYKHVFKRLKLTKLTDTADANNIHVFAYNEGTLPPKNSKNTDFWGYYNGRSFGAQYYSNLMYNNKFYEGADKKTRLEYMRIGSLKSIRYPLGELVQLTYEANKYRVHHETAGSTTVENKYVGYTVAKYYQDPVAENYPEYKFETVVFDRTTTININGWAESLMCRIDPSIIYDHPDVYPSFRLSKVNEFGYKETILDFGVPSALKSQCSYDFPATTRTVNAGTYMFEFFGVARDVVFSLTCQYEKLIDHTDQLVEGGGLRIAEISGRNARTFTYSDGVLLIDPSVCYLTDILCRESTRVYGKTTYLVQMSECTIPMSTFKQGNSIGYSSVTEKNSEYKNVHTFHNNREELWGSYPHIPTKIDYYNGLPMSIEYYKNGNQLQKRMEYEYKSNLNLLPKVYGFMFEPGGGLAYPYYYNIDCPQKNKEIITDFEGGSSIITEKKYDYNSWLQINAETVTSGGDTYQSKMVYPSDLSDATSRAMTDKNKISQPVEMIALKNGMVTMGKKTVYEGNSQGMFLPREEYTIETKAPLAQSGYTSAYVRQLSLDYYNHYGKPMEVSNKSDSVVYIWGYNGMYPVAEITNSTYNKVRDKLGDNFIQNLANKIAPDSSDMATLNALRSNLPDARVTTFTYSPLVGVTSVTDPRGMTTYYTYDASNRLQERYILKGQTKEILEHYDYHYYNKQ